MRSPVNCAVPVRRSFASSIPPERASMSTAEIFWAFVGETEYNAAAKILLFARIKRLPPHAVSSTTRYNADKSAFGTATPSDVRGPGHHEDTMRACHQFVYIPGTSGHTGSISGQTVSPLR